MAPAIRATGADDRPEVVELVRAAFGHSGNDGKEEVDIVEQTWTLELDGVIDLVAAQDDQIVGHVLGAPGTLEAGTELLAVAPLAVRPSHQGQGIGSRLMRELLRRADDAAWPAVVLLGNPDYYSRFGFEPAGPIGLSYAPVPPELPHFQVRKLTRWSPALQGAFVYCWERS